MLETDLFSSDLLPFDWSPSNSAPAPNGKVDETANSEQENSVGLLRPYHSSTEAADEADWVDSSQPSSSSTIIVEKHQSLFPDSTTTEKLLVALRNEDFEFGFTSYSESIVEEQLVLNKLATRNWLNELFVSHFGETKILVGLLHIISRFSELEMHPQGPTMALAALSHRHDEVQELAVRAFEHWGSLKSLEVLKHVHVGTGWLQKYINQVVEDLSLEHGIPCTQIYT